jgi:hypothetical protein
MNKVNIEDRLTFLAEKFDVFETAEDKTWEDKTNDLLDRGLADVLPTDGVPCVHPIGRSANVSDMLALLSTRVITKIDSRDDSEVEIVKKHISVNYDVFVNMLSADPSNNKMYLQWMLTVFTRLIKNGEIAEAIRFASEDLLQAKEYIEIFEKNKRKKKFKELCKNSYVLKGVNDPTNINQYKSLSQLFDAVDPFIERDPSDMERHMNKFVESGQALIPVKDRKFTVFIPLTRDANVLFDKFASWCTAKPDNGMFSHYREHKDYLKPNGKKSNIYIIINNKFFTGELEDNFLYQIHFESNQVRNRKQNGKGNFFSDVINKSEGVANYFNEELTGMAKELGTISKNVYIKYLIKFGWTEALFDMMDDFTPIIKFKDIEVPKMPDISKFKDLKQLIIAKGKLHNLHPSIGELINLRELILPDNNIKVIPKEIGNLKNLLFVNLIGNKVQEIPDDIKWLDKTNGGSLYRIACDRKEIGEANYQKLKQLLPSVKM